MSEFARILTNLGLAYGLMSKEQFVERVARYAQEKEMSEDKMNALIENLFEELELTYKRRVARQKFEAFEMNRRSQTPDADSFFNDMMNSAPEPAENKSEILNEMRAIRKALENLNSALKNKPEGE